MIFRDMHDSKVVMLKGGWANRDYPAGLMVRCIHPCNILLPNGAVVRNAWTWAD